MADPNTKLVPSIETAETYFMFTSYEQRRRKVFDVYRNDKRELLVLSNGSEIPIVALGISGARAEEEFSKSVPRSSQPFRDRAIRFATCGSPRSG
jgi:hypothetical protein